MKAVFAVLSALASPSPRPSVPSAAGPSFPTFDLAGLLNSWLAGLAHGAYHALLVPMLRIAMPLLLSTPRLDRDPHIVTLWHRSWTIALALYVLCWLGAALLIMTGHSFGASVPAGMMLLRLLFAPVLAATSLTVIGRMTDLSNALAGAIARDASVDPNHFLGSGSLPATQLVELPLLLVFLVLAALVLAVLLLIRLLLLALAAVLAPLLLLGHALPFTEPLARMWWKFVAGMLAIPSVEALLLAIGAAAIGSSNGALGFSGASLLPDALLFLALLLLMAAIPAAVLLRLTRTMPAVFPIARSILA